MSNNEEFIFFFKILSNKGAGGILFLFISLSLSLYFWLYRSLPLFMMSTSNKKIEIQPIFISFKTSIDRSHSENFLWPDGKFLGSFSFWVWYAKVLSLLKVPGEDARGQSLIMALRLYIRPWSSLVEGDEQPYRPLGKSS